MGGTRTAAIVPLVCILLFVAWETAFAEQSHEMPLHGTAIEAMAKAFNICSSVNQNNPNSCYGRCNSQSNLTHCGCDDLCIQYGDCCYDYELQCHSDKGRHQSGGQSLSPSSALKSILSRQNLSDSIGCLKPGTNDRYWYWTINRCPPFWSDDNVRTLCEDNDTFLSRVPVFGPEGVLYKNVFCAACHGIQRHDVEFWDVNTTCSSDTANKSLPELAQSSLSTSCKVIYFPPQNSNHSPRLPCGNVWSDCNDEGDIVMEKACKTYAAVVYHAGKGSWVKNPHCSLCRKAGINNLMCGTVAYGEMWWVNWVSFSTLLDFNSNSGLTVRSESEVRESHVVCDEHQVYDPFLDKCHQLSCPAYFELINGACKPKQQPKPIEDENGRSYLPVINSTLADNNISISTLYISAKLQIPGNQDISHRNQLLQFLNKVMSDILTISPGSLFYTNLKRYKFSQVNSSTEKNSRDLFVYSTFSKSNITLSVLARALHKNLNYGIQFQNTKIYIQSVMVDKSNFSAYSTCREKTVNDVTRNVENLSPKVSENKALQTNYSDKPRGETSSYWRILSAYDQESSTWHRRVHLLTCDEISLSCPMIRLDNKYVTFSEGATGTSVYYGPTNTVYEQGKYIVENGSVFVCSYLSQNGTRTDSYSAIFFEYSKAQTILTVVGSLLSLVFLTFSFITYCTFPSLRNLPGKTIMNLIVALFTAQAFLLFGSNQTQHYWFCASVAVVCHYFWLAVFFWMNVMAFDISRTFRKRLRPRNPEDRNVLLRRYMIYAWGAPALIVPVCVIVNFCDCANCRIGYGTGSSCWIEEPLALVISFMTPVGVIIFANLVMYLRTIHGIWSTSKIAQKVTKKSEAENLKTQLLLYLKLTTIMGFTWIFGFIAAFTGIQAFWYLFIVFNTLQGVFIFFAFTLNRRIIRMWRRRLSKHGRRRKSQTGVTPPTSSAKTKTTELLSGRVTSL
ncbi:uncharacterized protein [Ptychodera flava]|uniref:uncharacterized protein isoform X2 n=1 Tax=Ptychodera flava TaxID=63121 RepID=UPI003969BDF5